MRDRLRAVECPAEIIDQIGGWSTVGVGADYGLGYMLKEKAKFLERIATSKITDGATNVLTRGD